MLELIMVVSDKSPAIREYVKPIVDAKKVSLTVQPHPLKDSNLEKVYLMTGKEGLKWMSDRKMIRRGSTYAAASGRVCSFNSAYYIACPDPKEVEVNEELIPELQWSLILACRFITTGSREPQLGTYRYVKDFSDAVKFETNCTKPAMLALDLETIGLDPYHKADGKVPVDARIISIALTYKQGFADVLYLENGFLPGTIRSQLIQLFSSKNIKVTGANLKFDKLWLKVHFNLDIHNHTFDTNLVGSLLNENRSNSLSMHAKLFSKIGGYDSEFNLVYDKGRMDRIPKEALLPYAGGDTDACYQVSNFFKRRLVVKDKLCKFFQKIVMPAEKAITNIEYRGVVVDVQQYESLEKKFTQRIKDTTLKMYNMLPKYIQNRHQMDFNKPGIIRDYLFSRNGLGLEPLMRTGKTKEPACSANHYDMLLKAYDSEDLRIFLVSLKEYSGLYKALSTYILGFKGFIRSDGKFHPQYNLFKSYDGGTVTGRLSATNPGYQTIVKHGPLAVELRSPFVPPEGCSIIKLDYSQGELRLVADASGEKKMLDAFNSGEDLHKITACATSGVSDEQYNAMTPKEQAELRFGGKAGNFGLIYLMSAKGFQAYARTTFGVEMSMKDAEKYHANFFKLYPTVRDWQGDCINYARTHKKIVSKLGRERHLTMINNEDFMTRVKQERQSVNSGIQSCLSDMMLWAVATLYQEYPDLWCFGLTHDEAQFYVPTDDVLLWKGIIGEIMENLPFHEFGWNPKVKFNVDAEASDKHLGLCNGI